MNSGATIRGTRIGASSRENERGEAAPRREIPYYCINKHVTRPSFAIDVAEPERWECAHCGYPAGKDSANPPAAPRIEPYKSHLAYVQERRTPEEGDALVEEALAKLRARRGE